MFSISINNSGSKNSINHCLKSLSIKYWGQIKFKFIFKTDYLNYPQSSRLKTGLQNDIKEKTVLKNCLSDRSSLA